MTLHAFLTGPANLPRALRDGVDGFDNAVLTGADPANLSSLFELVTRGALPADLALAELEHPVAQAGAAGPWIYAVPPQATAALAAASASELDGWAADWAGADANPHDGSAATVRALAALASDATPSELLYIRLEGTQKPSASDAQ